MRRHMVDDRDHIKEVRRCVILRLWVQQPLWIVLLAVYNRTKQSLEVLLCWNAIAHLAHFFPASKRDAKPAQHGRNHRGWGISGCNFNTKCGLMSHTKGLDAVLRYHSTTTPYNDHDPLPLSLAMRAKKNYDQNRDLNMPNMTQYAILPYLRRPGYDLYIRQSYKLINHIL